MPKRILLGLIVSCVLCACDMTDPPERTTALSETGLFSANLSRHYALIGNLSGHAELWQLNPLAMLHKWQHTDESPGVIALDIARNEDYAVTAEKNSLAWWRISDGMLLSVWSLPDIYSVSISPDGQHALVGLAEKAVYLSLRNGQALYAFAHQDRVTCTDLSDNGLYALTGSEDQTAKLWNLSSGERQYTWQHDNKLAVVALGHTGKYALTSAALSQVRLWNISSGRIHRTIGPKRVTLSSAAFSDDDTLLLTGQISQLIELWHTASGNKVKFWRAKKAANWRPSAATILALQFDETGKKFNSVAANGFYQRWKAR